MILFKQKTAYEMRISDWSSDVCSSDLPLMSSYFVFTRSLTPTYLLSFCTYFTLSIKRPIHSNVWYSLAHNSYPTPHQTQRRKSLGTHQKRSEERRVGKECISK